jgi:hypothetical protein
MNICQLDHKHQKKTVMQYGALLNYPFEELLPESQDCVLTVFSHSKNCPYHDKGWYFAFADFLEEGMTEFSRQEFDLLKRNIEVIFCDYL